MSVVGFKDNTEVEILNQGNEKLSSALSVQVTKEMQVKLMYVILQLLPKL